MTNESGLSDFFTVATELTENPGLVGCPQCRQKVCEIYSQRGWMLVESSDRLVMVETAPVNGRTNHELVPAYIPHFLHCDCRAWKLEDIFSAKPRGLAL